ncbi:MAG TPA: hypothetical protein VF590_25320, partial [Isosphaeraceae bacterium]
QPGSQPAGGQPGSQPAGGQPGSQPAGPPQPASQRPGGQPSGATPAKVTGSAKVTRRRPDGTEEPASALPAATRVGADAD